MKLYVVFVLLSLVLFGESKKYSAVYNKTTHKWSVVEGQNGIAWAELVSNMNHTGWDTITVVTDGTSNDKEQAFAAGYIEAALTVDTIWQTWMNLCNGTTFDYSSQMGDFIKENYKWLQETVATPTENFDYWQQVGLVLAQYDGMYKGYNQFAGPDKKLNFMDFLILQLQSETDDIEAAVDPSEYKPSPISGSHCSGLVRLSPSKRQLFVSHVTWSGFENMLRLWKHYNFKFASKGNKAPTVSYSGYPGYIPSGDDYFVTGTNLVVMETTNEVMNMSLYQFVTTKTVPYWIRVTVANRMASSGKEWVDTFALYNSGTYNNQWMVVDNKLFSKGEPLKAGTLWVAEQIPGYVISADKTDVLSSQGFWPSYNIPYFPFIYDISGYPAYFAKYGNSYSYSKCARAQIFARDARKVESFEDMKKIMRYNEYQTDPLSLHDACRGVSARCDLNPPWAQNTLNSYTPFGGIDCKITDDDRAAKMHTEAVSGPTWEAQPPFAWTKQWADYPRFGQPDVFAFYFEKMEPKW